MKKKFFLVLVILGANILHAKSYHQCSRYLSEADKYIRKYEDTILAVRATAYSTAAVAYLKRYEICVQRLKDKENDGSM